MTNSNKSTGNQSSTRRDRRAEQRTQRTTQRGSPGKSSQPLWRSPIVLLTGAAVVIGVIVIAFAILTQPAQQSQALTPPAAPAPTYLADGRTLGSADAPVTVDIWADFQCPFCGRLARNIEPSLTTSFVAPGYAQIVYHDLAFLGQPGSSWDESVAAASAARCAEDQGKFWDMNAWLFANQAGENEGGFSQARLHDMAAAAGLDTTAYDSCMAVGDKQAAVKAETTADLAAGIKSTPTLKLNGVIYTGDMTYQAIAAAITDAAGGATPAPVPTRPAATSAP